MKSNNPMRRFDMKPDKVDYAKLRSSAVALLPDRGERHPDTVFSDKWIFSHCGAAEGARE
jgi:hypothetical protein